MRNFYKFILTLSLSLTVSNSFCQFVNIPDANFRFWLNNNGYALCMSGNDLDTTCLNVISAVSLNVEFANISNLEGVQYFDNLDTLHCNDNNLATLPQLPATLLFLDCRNNNLTILPSLPPALIMLTCDNNLLTTLPSLPTSITSISCTSNLISTLPALPAGLAWLNCIYNNLTVLPALPTSLYNLQCSGNQLTTLPSLPASLTHLFCSYNQITTLPALPAAMIYLHCSGNPLNVLPVLPSTLAYLFCASNQLTTLPVLSPNLYWLECDSNSIPTLPPLPLSLEKLNCASNLLSVWWDSLPPNLEYLDCSYNFFTIADTIPASLKYFYCQNNQIASLTSDLSNVDEFNCSYNQITSFNHSVPDMNRFDCSNNPCTNTPYDFPNNVTWFKINNTLVTCFPELNKVTWLEWNNVNITCLPNVIDILISATPSIAGMPLCQPSANCQGSWNISGNVYHDLNSNCINNVENNLVQIPVKLDSAGIFIQLCLTDQDGNYNFRCVPGNYSVYVDTTMLSFDVTCPPTGNYNITLTAINPTAGQKDFALECEPGIDLVVQDIAPGSVLRPGAQTYINLIAGEQGQLYGSSCFTTGLSGNVQAVLDGPASIVGAAAGSLVPSLISGDTILWNVPNFAFINPFTSFNFIVAVDSLATTSDTICITGEITPIAGDPVPANNTLNRCLPVFNSANPNLKQMLPSGPVDTSQYWFDFIIYFQNTENTTVEDIFIIDTLDSYLDPSTFTFLSSSHQPVIQLLPGNILRFNFPDINLPDSISDEPGSHGYVSFKVRRDNGLPIGTVIENTAAIYFDINPAVITNTVFAILSINVSLAEYQSMGTTVYPNPTNGIVRVILNNPQPGNIELLNSMGQVIALQKIDATTSELLFDISNQPSGIYFMRVNGIWETAVKKIVKH